MAETGIGSKLNKQVLLDKSGEIVEHEAEAYGLQTEYMMRQRQDKLVFVDEVAGSANISTTKDGNVVGGEKFLCEASWQPQMKAATKDSHFTALLMRFTAAPANR